MPLYMDRHDAEGVTAEAVAQAHLKDLAIKDKFGAVPLTYWCDEPRGAVFCLIAAPSADAVRHLHAEAHGLVPNQVIEVDQTLVQSFLGRVTDPAGHGPIAESAFRAIMFTDMASSTDITNALGDDAAYELLQRHHRIVREALAANEGREVDRAGDGVLASFFTVHKAVGCAIAIQRALAEHNRRAPAAPIRVRIGLAAGEPVTEENRLFGAVVNLGARICSHAQPEQILAAHVIRELCAGKNFHFDDCGEVELKGFQERVRLHTVAWQDQH